MAATAGPAGAATWVHGRIINHIFGIFTLLTSFVLFVAGREHKALHDWIAGTVVLHDPDKLLSG
jgi:uncharacterized RDD family membrane protein YckC